MWEILIPRVRQERAIERRGRRQMAGGRHTLRGVLSERKWDPILEGKSFPNSMSIQKTKNAKTINEKKEEQKGERETDSGANTNIFSGKKPRRRTIKVVRQNSVKNKCDGSTRNKEIRRAEGLQARPTH